MCANERFKSLLIKRKDNQNNRDYQVNGREAAPLGLLILIREHTDGAIVAATTSVVTVSTGTPDPIRNAGVEGFPSLT